MEVFGLCVFCHEVITAIVLFYRTPCLAVTVNFQLGAGLGGFTEYTDNGTVGQQR